MLYVTDCKDIRTHLNLNEYTEGAINLPFFNCSLRIL